eukprot:CAMPEP_0170507814 /NCGR_PEP_ID=MMETSP0208-20121228/60229_1 /TAXON_ID=197538 /ORGANISM="Strombidium inclinatum, Strain S3" /LENGTH=364 /DNA_ID=CAMNT_0010790297 /DNA_START=953 /DNA_END=2048 /DNA_ORIENTATION=+
MGRGEWVVLRHREVQEAAAARREERVAHLAVLPPDRRQSRRVLTNLLLPHLVHLRLGKVDPLGVVLFLAEVVASEQPPGVLVEVDLPQFDKAFQQCFHVVRPDAEDGVVLEALRQRSAASLVIFHPQLRALLLYFLLDELRLEAVHGLLDLLLGRDGALQPGVIPNLGKRRPVHHIIGDHLENQIFELGRKIIRIASVGHAGDDVLGLGWFAKESHAGGRLADEARQQRQVKAEVVQKEEDGIEHNADALKQSVDNVGYQVEGFDPRAEEERLLRAKRFEHLALVRSEPAAFALILDFLVFHLTFKKLSPLAPELSWLFGLNVLVERVLDLSLAQVRQGARGHDKEDDAHGEHVGALPSVVLLP